VSRKITDILVHLDWVERHGHVKYQYSQPVVSPFLIGSSSRLLVPPEKLLEAEEISSPLFNEQGFCSIAAAVPRNGMYFLYLRPRHRLAKLIVNPESVVVDLLCDDSERLCYAFFNPTNREAITVTAQLVEDVDGVYRKISAFPDDLTWRQYFIRRAMARSEPKGIHDAEPEYPEIMTANQVASYLGFEAKTIRNWTSEGTIPHKKIGGSPRYLKSEIDDALKQEALGRKKPGKANQAKPKKS
jgi:excisionase family DNA binding protein